ncbi:CaiB/BaiF CoA transferase family protein [Steroidobacter flavus]|uniref:CaiB/BaiF CoA transferase family protein n=1 Tax=Steroidobacter flavus TaxID=1842136 RepID=A0ABV8SY34_9GAMM
MSVDDSSALPLSGITVIELGSLIAGPYAGSLFAQFGAEVIKVEPPGGDPLRTWRKLHGDTSLWWYVQSRNKKSVALDLASTDGQAALKKLVERADVVIENFRPGTLERWGLGWAELSQINPKLVMLRVSGYGQDGPKRDLPGFAAIAEAVGGLRYVTGFADRPPVRTGVSLGDTLAALYGTIGTMVALHHVKNGGAGQVVDMALNEAVFAVMESLVPEYSTQGFIRERSGASLPGIAPSNTYECADGRHVVIAANADSLFQRLMIAIDREDLAKDPGLQRNDGRVAHADELDAAINAWTSRLPIDEVVRRLELAAVPASKIHSAADIVNDPQLQARGMLESARLPDGLRLTIPGIVPKLSATPGRTRWLGPRLGAHSEEILGAPPPVLTTKPD